MSVGLDVSPGGLGGPLVTSDSAVMSVGLPGSPVSLLPGSTLVGDHGAPGASASDEVLLHFRELSYLASAQFAIGEFAVSASIGICSELENHIEIVSDLSEVVFFA